MTASDHAFSDQDYPGLYQDTDSKSINTQAKYFSKLKWFLVILVLGSFVNLFAGINQPLAVLSVLLFSGSLILSILIALRRDDRTWYSARAVAESVKTRTWRFMMKAKPYGGDISDDEARRLFLNDLEEILNENKEVTNELCNESSSNKAVSPKMLEIRSLSLSDRFSFYMTIRIQEQLSWYKKKARQNKKLGERWFAGIVILNGFALILSLVRVCKLAWSFLPTDVFAVAAASVVSWLQAKRFNELSTSYALAAHEIEIIESRLPSVDNEEEFSDFVNNTENAFSREHTQWAARRDSSFKSK